MFYITKMEVKKIVIKHNFWKPFSNVLLIYFLFFKMYFKNDFYI